MKPQTPTIHVRLPHDTFARIQQLALENKRPKSYMARELIEKSLAELRDLEDAPPRKAARR
jgi:predicted DNA-binding protein